MCTKSSKYSLAAINALLVQRTKLAHTHNEPKRKQTLVAATKWKWLGTRVVVLLLHFLLVCYLLLVACRRQFLAPSKYWVHIILILLYMPTLHILHTHTSSRRHILMRAVLHLINVVCSFPLASLTDLGPTCFLHHFRFDWCEKVLIENYRQTFRSRFSASSHQRKWMLCE